MSIWASDLSWGLQDNPHQPFHGHLRLMQAEPWDTLQESCPLQTRGGTALTETQARL